jgi:CHASE2 domain-containing sensor protein
LDNATHTLRGREKETGRLGWISHGFYEFKGVLEPVEICEVYEQGIGPDPIPPKNGEKAWRVPHQLPEHLDENDFEGRGWRKTLSARKCEIVLSICAALFAVFCTMFTPIGGLLAGFSYDFAYTDIAQLGVRPIPTEAVIVYMDEDSHTELHQPDNAPWDHSVHTKLIECLTSANPKAIVFDVLFTSNQPSSGELIEACRKNRNVFVGALEKGSPGDTYVVGPFDGLARVASFGLVESHPLATTARRHYRSVGFTHRLTLAEMVAEKIRPGSAKQKGVRWLNYYGPPGTLPNVSYHRVITNGVPSLTFNDKIVFVGAQTFAGYSGGRGTNDYVRAYDDFFTPFSGRGFGKSPGVDLNAIATLNILRGESLRQLKPELELTVFLVVAVVVAFLVSVLPPWWSAGGGLISAIGFAVGSSWLTWQTYYWFSWATVSLVEIPIIVMCSIVYRAQNLFRQKRSLEKFVKRQTEYISKASSRLQSPLVNKESRPAVADHELLLVIGKGAYGEVWLARDLTNSFRAIKIVRRSNFDSTHPFDRELEGIKRFAPLSLSHPGLVNVFYVGNNQDGTWFYYIMETADDVGTGRAIEPARYRPKTLASILEGTERIGNAETITLGIQLADALGCLHRNKLLHRDLKPTNVLFINGRPQLADPGLVAFARTAGVSMVGTAGYMAPEPLATEASDIYSLGKILYQVGFGCAIESFPALPSFVKSSDNDGFILGLNDIILKACETSAEKRHRTTDALRAELEALAQRLGLLPLPSEL